MINKTLIKFINENQNSIKIDIDQLIEYSDNLEENNKYIDVKFKTIYIKRSYKFERYFYNEWLKDKKINFIRKWMISQEKQ